MKFFIGRSVMEQSSSKSDSSQRGEVGLVSFLTGKSFSIPDCDLVSVANNV